MSSVPEQEGSAYPVEIWLAEEELAAVPTAAYWNDRNADHRKGWATFSPSAADDNPLRERVTSLSEHAFAAVAAAEAESGRLAGRGASLASGTCWLEAEILQRRPKISHLHCVELSKHRILEIAPRVLAREGIAPDRATLCVGSFYDLRVDDASLDFVLLCQAFHHADDPDRLLREVNRVLAPRGRVIIAADHYFGYPERLRRAVRHLTKWVLNHRGYRGIAPFRPRWRTLFRPSRVKGDHHLSPREYREIFERHGFRATRVLDRTRGRQGFVLTRHTSPGARP